MDVLFSGRRDGNNGTIAETVGDELIGAVLSILLIGWRPSLVGWRTSSSKGVCAWCHPVSG